MRRLTDRFTKNTYKILSVLGLVFLFGIQKAQALIPLLVGLGVGAAALFSGALGDVAEGVAKGFASLLGIVIKAVGGIFFFIANAAVRFAIELNTLITSPDNIILQDGHGIALTIANIGLVAGLIVIAIATMIRAEWIVQAREALPKFLAAALLMNFSLFIFLHVIIAPVDALTNQMYKAANLNENTFRGPFSVDLDLSGMLEAQIAIAKSDNPNDAALIEEYFQFVDSLKPLIYDELVRAEEENFREDLVSSDLDGFSYFGGRPINIEEGRVSVTDRQRLAVVSIVTRNIVYDYIFGRTFGVDRGNASDTWDELERQIEGKLDEGGAPYANNDIYKGGYTSTDLARSLRDIAKQAYLKSPPPPEGGYACNIETGINKLDAATGLPGFIAAKLVEDDNQLREDMLAELGENPTGCARVQRASVLSMARPGALESIIIVFVEVLFEGLFIFLGSFSLLALASMLFIRYISLNILLILFPFVWFGWIFPKLAAVGNKNIWTAWWNQFIRWLLFGPVVMFFLFIAIRGTVLLSQYTPNASAFYGDKSTMSILAAAVGTLLTVLGLLLGGIYAANKMGIAGSSIFYNSAIKMRNWAGRQVKRAAKGTLVNKYTKRGWEHTKSATTARRAQLQSGHLLTKQGEKKTKELLQSDDKKKQALGRSRMRRARRAELAIQGHAKRKTQVRNLEGKLEDIPGGFRRSQRLAGLLENFKNPDGSFKKNLSGQQLAEIGMLAQGLHDDGFQWEAPFQDAMALLETNDGFRKLGLQKMDNEAQAMGLAPKVLKKAHEGRIAVEKGEMTEEAYKASVVQETMEAYNKIPDHKLNFDHHLFGEYNPDNPMFGMGKEEFEATRDAAIEYMTARPSTLQKHINKVGTDGRRMIVAGIEKRIGQVENDLFGTVASKNTEIPIAGRADGAQIPFKEASVNDKLAWLENNYPEETLAEIIPQMDQLKQLHGARRGGYAGMYFYESGS